MKPEHPFIFMELPVHTKASTFIESVGWVLDGESVIGTGNDKAVDDWLDEVALEQGTSFLNAHMQYAISGWALYGEIVTKEPLKMGDWIAAGVQTNIFANRVRTAVVKGVDLAETDGVEVFGIATSTYHS